MAHISGLVAAGLHPEPVRVRRHRHLHHAQDAARAARGPHPGQGEVRRGHRQERSSPASRAGRWCTSSPPRRSASWKPCSPSSSSTRSACVANASALAEALIGAGFRVVSGGTDTHLMLVDVFSKGMRGKEAEQALDRARITVNKNAIPVRHQSADEPQRHPPGLARRHHARLRGGRDARGRRADRRSARPHRPTRTPSPRCGAASSALTARFPLYGWKLGRRFEPSEIRRRAVWRCTSSSTPGASGTSASAPISAAWCTRSAPSTRTNHYTLVSASGGRPHAGRPAAELPLRALQRARIRPARSRRRSPLFLRGLSPDLVHIPAQPRAAADDPRPTW